MQNMTGILEADKTDRHTLSLSPDYVMEWRFWEACRELIQNSIDQCRRDTACHPIFQYNEITSTLTIGTTNCEISPRTLLLGASDKRTDDTMIGQFGEGYKLALLVLVRSQYEVVIYNGANIWRPSFVYDERYGEHLLTIDIEPNPERSDGVVFAIRDVSPETYGEIHANYLMNESSDKIFDEDHMRGRVFVGGLYVCEVEGLQYGYNFAPGRIKLDRDRGMASSFEVTYESSRLWEQSGDDAKLYDNITADILDTQHVQWSRPSTNQYVAERFAREHGNAVPVSSQQEMDAYRGRNTQLVSAPFRNLLHRMNSYVFNRTGTPSQRLEQFSKQFGRYMGKQQSKEFDAILEDSKQWWS